MSVNATTLLFCIGLYRHQLSDAFYFRDYNEMARELAAKVIGKGC